MMAALARPVRTCVRLGWLAFFAVAAACHFGLLCLRHRGAPPLRIRAQWLHRWCRRALPRLGISLQNAGRPPQRGLLVSNHLSYLDILVLSAATPCIFVAKQEVYSWPIFGWLTRMSGAIFITRGRLRELPRVISEMEKALRQGVTVVLFPEGTTTNGSAVLPFRSALFQSAINAGEQITAAQLSFADAHGRRTAAPCWWGEMTLLPHLVRLFALRKVHARLRFGQRPRSFPGRKLAAVLTREEVALLARKNLILIPGGKSISRAALFSRSQAIDPEQSSRHQSAELLFCALACARRTLAGGRLP